MSEDGKITVTVRLIRSFEFRNIKNIIIRNVDKKTLVTDFIKLINEGKSKIKTWKLIYLTIWI